MVLFLFLSFFSLSHFPLSLTFKGNLSKIFHTIDTDGSGTISIDELREALDNEGLEFGLSSFPSLVSFISLQDARGRDWRADERPRH